MFKKLKPDLFRDKTKEELDEHYNKTQLEKGDLTAMIIAAFLTFAPIIIGVSLVYIVIAFLFGA